MIEVARLKSKQFRVSNCFFWRANLAVIVYFVDFIERHRILVFKVEDDLKDSLTFGIAFRAFLVVLQYIKRNSIITILAVSCAKLSYVLRLETHQKSSHSKLSFVLHVGC